MRMLAGLVGLLGLSLLAARAVAEPPDDELPAFQLKGPFASRAEACEAALGERGTCTTYRAVAAAPASGSWQAIELAAVVDRGSRRSSTRHFGLFVEVGKHWFANYLGTDGTIDTELFPPCGGPADCTPRHVDKPSFFTVPRLSLLEVVRGGGKQLVLFFPTAADVGFRQVAPHAELVSVCGLGPDSVPSCTPELIAMTPSGSRIKSVAELFTTSGEMTIALANGNYQPWVGHFKFR